MVSGNSAKEKQKQTASWKIRVDGYLLVARGHLGIQLSPAQYKQSYKWSHFKMEAELPSQRGCLARLMPQTSRVLTGQNNLGTGPKATSCPKNCVRDSKKANIKATGLMPTGLTMKNIV